MWGPKKPALSAPGLTRAANAAAKKVSISERAGLPNRAQATGEFTGAPRGAGEAGIS